MSRVLLVGKGPPDRGGISAYLQGLLASDLARRHDLRLLNLAHEGIPRAGRLTTSNVTRTVRDAVRLWRASGGADIVHIHTALVPAVTLIRAGLLALVARLRGSAVVVHVHSGLVELWLTSLPRRALARAALAPAHRVVTMSSQTLAALAAASGPGRVALIDNGVDLGAYAAADPVHAPPRILYVGLLTPRKGVVDLLRASALLTERGIAHEVVLVGGMPDEGPDAEAAVRREATPNVRFEGAVPHETMAGRYRDADVLCLPSWFEAVPLSILEAMASGLPVVATRVGDIPRIVAEGTTGLVVPPRDPARLADALATLLAHPERRRAMGCAGRERAEALFDSAAAAARVGALYEQLSP